MRARVLISVCALLLLSLGSCSIQPPLHLREPADVDVIMSAHVELDVMWQIDWEARWEFRWEASQLGPVGYEEPKGMRLHAYALSDTDEYTSHQIFNFTGYESRLRLYAGYFGFLFHNNDSETILFESDDDYSDIWAYTRVISKGLKASSIVETMAQKSAATKADGDYDPGQDPVVLAPDGLFSLYSPRVWISDKLEDYEYIDGRYIYRIQSALRPATFIYLFQIRLLNNGGRVVGSTGGAALTGMATRTNLHAGRTSEERVSVPMDVYINRADNPDLMGARLMTFGIPGCEPYDPASVSAAPQVPHYLVLNVSYSNGSYRNIRIDVTDQVRALPTGGVIDLEIDVDDFPPDPEPGPDGGGFSALVQDWQEEQGSYTIVQ